MGYRVICKPHCIMLIPDYGKKLNSNSHAALRRQSTVSELSENARRKMKDSLRWLIAASAAKTTYEKKRKQMVEWKINLGTLTFKNNMTDDNLARQILSRWLEMAKYRFNMHSYVWKAEPQSRGAIHFHFSTNVYIPYAELRFTWNRALRKAGLENCNENSTDIHAVESIDNIEKYLCDYYLNEAKHEGRRKIKGKQWACSHNIAALRKNYLFVDDDEAKAIANDLDKFSLNKAIVAEGKPLPDFLKYVDYYKVDSRLYESLRGTEIGNLYWDSINSLQVKSQLQFFQRTCP